MFSITIALTISILSLATSAKANSIDLDQTTPDRYSLSGSTLFTSVADYFEHWTSLSLA